MIICILESNDTWDEYVVPFLLNTDLLKNKQLKAFFKSANHYSLQNMKSSLSTILSENFDYQDYYNEIIEAMVDPPQLVEKIILLDFNRVDFT